MNNQTIVNGANNAQSLRVRPLAMALVFLTSMAFNPALQAGAYIFAGEANGIDVITHPTGYLGSGGTLNVGVCIDPNSQYQSELVIPVLNTISVWNDLQPVESNLDPNAVSGLDLESVLLHEVGHCIGLAHVNAASESGLNENDYTKATNGSNNNWDVDSGPDGVPGTFDDVRGDDQNLHWFNPANNPFQLPIHTPVDTTQYRRESADLPPGHSFAQNASREMAAHYGLALAEAVMQQLTYYSETQRELISDGASTVMLAASGLDETAGTADDYQLVLNYEGVSDDPSLCDITVIIENSGSFAHCSTSGFFVGDGHVRISAASVHLGSNYNWHFNTELRGGGNQAPVAVDDVAAVDEDNPVIIDVLANDNDPDGDPLDVNGVSNPANGNASVNADNSINYTPNPNFNGVDSFSYTLVDDTTGSDTGNVTVTVNPVNDSPLASNDSGISTDLGNPVDIFVLDNDSDPENDALSVVSATDPAKGSTSINANHSIRYTPDPGTSGPDSFNYVIDDGKGGSDSATVTVDVLAANQLPAAVFSHDCTGTTCSFDASASNDPDGTVVDFSWDFGDGGNGNGSTPSHSYASAGNYTVTLTVTDDRAGTDDRSELLTVEPNPVGPDYAIADFNTSQGSLSGSYLDTHAAGGGTESLTETHSGGKPSLRSDALDHIWQFNLAEGNTTFNVTAQASFPSGDLDSSFLFQWSTSSNGGWADMLTVPGPMQSFDLGAGVSGTVYVRVVDTDDTQGNTELSTIAVDHMYFNGATPPTEPPAPASNPNPATGDSGVPVNTTLSWSKSMGTASVQVLLGTVSGSLSPVANDPAASVYNPGTLNTSTTYYWRVDSTNPVGTTVGDEWSFTTSSNSGPTELQIGGIVLETVNAGKGNKAGQAMVTVLDDLGNAVSGATVHGSFSGSYSESASADTDGTGNAMLTTAQSTKGGVSFTFCVDDVIGSLPYNLGQICQNF